jgi:hypothetical protein
MAHNAAGLEHVRHKGAYTWGVLCFISSGNTCSRYMPPVVQPGTLDDGNPSGLSHACMDVAATPQVWAPDDCCQECARWCAGGDELGCPYGR